jgi:hypothetical protein
MDSHFLALGSVQFAQGVVREAGQCPSRLVWNGVQIAQLETLFIGEIFATINEVEKVSCHAGAPKTRRMSVLPLTPPLSDIAKKDNAKRECSFLSVRIRKVCGCSQQGTYIE